MKFQYNNFYLQQKYDESLEYYDKVLEIDPSYISALNNKATILKDLKRYDEAIQYYDKALSIEPSNVEVLLDKGSILYGLGKYDDAKIYYEKSLKINPNLTSFFSKN